MAFGVYTPAIDPYQVQNGTLYPLHLHKFSCSDSLAVVTAAGYLNLNLNATLLSQITANDVFEVSYAGGTAKLYPLISASGVVTLVGAGSALQWVDVTATAAALATAGKVNVMVAPSTTSQFVVRDLRVNLSTGLSGGGGDRLLGLKDGTLVFNNAGITAALLGTAINTVWGGSGNPLPAIAMNTPSTAGANIYFQYLGGATDFTAGSVVLSALLQRVA